MTDLQRLARTLLVVGISAAPLTAQEIQFQAGDQLVHADLHAAAGRDAPIVLLFHQAGGDARSEYADIVPRLTATGYNAMTVDTRGGGTRFGGVSRAPAVGEGFSYCAALVEVDGAVTAARANGFTGPIVLWGSSYTGALVLQVAARRSADVGAVLAFSPASGPPMAGCEPEPLAAWLVRTGVPALVIKPTRETISELSRAQLAAFAAAGLPVYIPEVAAHGSSVLSATRASSDVTGHWARVLAFLDTALQPRLPNPADRRVTIEHDGWQLVGDLRLPSAPKPPLVVLLNKAAGSRRAYDALATSLAQRGIESLRIDLPGHGESINRGRFIPGVTNSLLDSAEQDVIAILRWVAQLAEVDSGRVAVVGASYSAEAMAQAGRLAGYAQAYVALSPGSFSDASFEAIDPSGVPWLLVRSDRERFVTDWLDAKLRDRSRTGQLWVVEAGSAHATDLLAADGGLGERLADWLAGALRP